MATITLSSGNTIRPYRSPFGGFPVRGYPLSTGISSNVIRIGQVVQLDPNTSSVADCIVPSPLSSSSLNVAGVVGVAAESPGAANGNTGLGSTNTCRTTCMVWEANPQVEFKGWCKGATLASSNIGTIYELSRDSTLNIDFVNIAASSLATPAHCVIVTGFIDNIGDVNGAVSFRFNTSCNFLAFYK